MTDTDGQAVMPVTPPPATTEERTWAMACHLAGLGGYVIPFGNIVGPLIVWNLQKEKYPLVVVHGRNAVNFQISMTIWILVAVPFCFMCVGIPVVVALSLFDLVCLVIAAVKASDGKEFKYPISIRFLK